MRLWTRIAHGARNEEGSSFVEYALAILFILLSSLAALRMIGVEISLDIRQIVGMFR